jgi:hypothetical protein
VRKEAIAVVLSALVLVAACAAATLREPEPPRVRCVPLGQVPNTEAWVYVCTFTGEDADSVAVPPSVSPDITASTLFPH